MTQAPSSNPEFGWLFVAMPQAQLIWFGLTLVFLLFVWAYLWIGHRIGSHDPRAILAMFFRFAKRRH